MKQKRTSTDEKIANLLREAEINGDLQWEESFPEGSKPDLPAVVENDSDLATTDDALTPHQVKERMRNRISLRDYDKIADHWITQAKTSKSPAWAKFFAETFMPDDAKADNPLEAAIAHILSQRISSAVAYQVSVEEEMQGYIDSTVSDSEGEDPFGLGDQ